MTSIASQENDLHSVAQRLIQLARREGLTIATVESCTAGRMATALAEAVGAGDVLHGGFVVYSKENKTAALGVPADVIRKHTAVSAQVVKLMAEGGLQRSPAELALAITGVAGPEPDEDGNPVGLVFIAAGRKGGSVLERRLMLKGSKDDICQQAMIQACEMGVGLVEHHGHPSSEAKQAAATDKLVRTYGLTAEEARRLSQQYGSATAELEGAAGRLKAGRKQVSKSPIL